MLARPAHLLVAFLVVLHLMSAVPPALAGEQTGDLEVTARSDSGTALGGVTLSLTGSSLQASRSGETDPGGRFTFRALPPGTYRLDCSLDGRPGLRLDAIAVNVGKTSPVPVVLASGALEEFVTVKAETPLVDAVRTTTQDTYDREYLDRAQIGLEYRSYTMAAVAGPSALPYQAAPGRPPYQQYRGAEFTDNLNLVDGVNINDPLYSFIGVVVPFDAVEEIQVQTGGFQPEFGWATGGVTNVVTKSGGNDFSGSLDLRFGDKGMMASGDNFDPDEVEYRRSAAEVTFGGPIVKDKLWFFAGGAYYLEDSAPPDALTTTNARMTSWLGKLTWQVAPSHQLSFEGLGMPGHQDNAAQFNSIYTTPEAATREAFNARFWTAQYRGVLGPRLIVQAQVGHYGVPVTWDPQSGDTTTPCVTNFVTGMQTGNSCVIGDNDRNRDLAMASATWQAGRHTLKGGVDLQRTESYAFLTFPGGVAYGVAPDANGVETVLYENVVGSPQDGTTRGEFGGYYVQDEWRVHPRVNLNLGLRYTVYTYFNDVGNDVWPSTLWEPRLGIAWDATGDARNVFKLSASRLGQSSTLLAATYTNERTLEQNLYYNETISGYFAGEGPVPLDVNGDGVIEERAFAGTYGGTANNVFANGGAVKMPHVDEFAVSYERRLQAESAIGATYVRRRGRDLIEDTYDEASGKLIIDNLPGLATRFEAIEIRYRGQWHGFHLRGSYVWSKNEGNVWYQGYGLNWDYDFPATSENRWGWLPTDTRHGVKVNGWWTLPVGFQIGYGAVYYSGFPWTYRQPALPWGDEFPEGRGSRRLPSFRQLDLEFSKGFAIGKTDLRLYLSVINLLNAESVTAVNEYEPLAGQPTDYQKPLRIQLGMHYRF